MNIIKEDPFRSPDYGAADMVRATIDFTAQEFKDFKNKIIIGPCTYPLLCANAVKGDEEELLCTKCPYGFNGPGKLLE